MSAALGALHYQLSPNVAITTLDDSVVIVGESFLVRIEGPIAVRGALEKLARGAQVDEIVDAVGDPDTALALLTGLAENGLLTKSQPSMCGDALVDQQSGYFADWTSAPSDALSSLRASRVGVVGVGGVGSVALQHLAAAGVGSLEIVDYDEVALGNLNRQFVYRTSDVGLPKVDVAVRYVAERYPSCTVRPHRSRIESEADLYDLALDDIDLVILAADEPPQEVEEIVATWAMEANVAFSTAGVGIRRGYWGPILPPGTSASLQYLRERIARDNEGLFAAVPSKALPPIPSSFGPTNTIVSAAMVRDVIHFLAGLTESPSFEHRLTIDFETFAVARCSARPR